MLTSITFGMLAYRTRKTSAGIYFDAYHVSELTGRKCELVTVVPAYVWNKPNSPYYNSYQLPVSELIDEQEMQRLALKNPLHPAMAIGASRPEV